MHVAVLSKSFNARIILMVFFIQLIHLDYFKASIVPVVLCPPGSRRPVQRLPHYSVKVSKPAKPIRVETASDLSALSFVEMQRLRALQRLALNMVMLGVAVRLVSLVSRNLHKGQPSSRLTSSGWANLIRSWCVLSRIFKLCFPPPPWMTASWLYRHLGLCPAFLLSLVVV